MEKTGSNSSSSLTAWTNRASALGQELYDLAYDTPLKKVIVGITALLNTNAYIIFWGGAIFSVATQPQTFLIGTAVGITAAVLLPKQWDLDILKVQLGAVHTTARTVIFLWSFTLNALTRAFIGGLAPGYHIYKACSGDYYGGMTGAKALAFEFEYMCWEISQWIPCVNMQPPLHVVTSELKASQTPKLWG